MFCQTVHSKCHAKKLYGVGEICGIAKDMLRKVIWHNIQSGLTSCWCARAVFTISSISLALAARYVA